MEPIQKRMKINPQERRMMDLPDEILTEIFLNVSQQDIHRNLALVCRRFKDITRSPIFAPNVKIEPVFKDIPYLRIPIIEFPDCAVRKMEHMRKIYPKCTFEIRFTAYEPKCQCEHCDQCVEEEHFPPLLIGYAWMKEFLPFANSIIKLDLRVEQNDIKDFDDFIRLENLELLDLDSVKYIEDLDATFWDNFPNLKVLKIYSQYDGKCVS